jgi:hypothetical protein
VRATACFNFSVSSSQEEARNRNQNEILLTQRIAPLFCSKGGLDGWLVYFSSFSEGVYQNIWGTKQKLGQEREREHVCVCVYRVPFSSVFKMPLW